MKPVTFPPQARTQTRPELVYQQNTYAFGGTFSAGDTITITATVEGQTQQWTYAVPLNNPAPLWQKGHAYAIGDVIRPSSQAFHFDLVCYEAGTSNAHGEPNWASTPPLYSDGTVAWAQTPVLNGALQDFIQQYRRLPASSYPTLAALSVKQPPPQAPYSATQVVFTGPGGVEFTATVCVQSAAGWVGDSSSKCSTGLVQVATCPCCPPPCSAGFGEGVCPPVIARRTLPDGTALSWSDHMAITTQSDHPELSGRTGAFFSLARAIADGTAPHQTTLPAGLSAPAVVVDDGGGAVLLQSWDASVPADITLTGFETLGDAEGAAAQYACAEVGGPGGDGQFWVTVSCIPLKVTGVLRYATSCAYGAGNDRITYQARLDSAAWYFDAQQFAGHFDPLGYKVIQWGTLFQNNTNLTCDPISVEDVQKLQLVFTPGGADDPSVPGTFASLIATEHPEKMLTGATVTSIISQ